MRASVAWRECSRAPQSWQEALIGGTGEAALVLFSGGQDSATCVAWALERFARVETVGFDYGQRHRVELDVRTDFLKCLAAIRPQWGARLGPDHVLRLDALGQISETALTRGGAFETLPSGLPNTFVPGRNLIFLTYAGALAWRRGLTHLVAGMCETDYSGYPDCRNDTLVALTQAMRLGMDYDFSLETPLMWLDKAQTWALAEDIGGAALVEAIIEDTHTCYAGDRTARHEWGYGCGSCPACALRQKGWQTWQARRKTS